MAHALSIHNLTKTYSNGFEALKGVSLSVEEGDFYALLGPNGAGKSTTIGIICSLITKSGGTVRIFDKDIDDDFSSAKRSLGLVPRNSISMFLSQSKKSWSIRPVISALIAQSLSREPNAI